MNNASRNEQRSAGLDLVKLVACFFIIGLHTQRNIDTGVLFNPVIYYLSRGGIPLFFMTNGFLILKKKEFSLKYGLKKIISILRVTLIWSFISWFCLLIFNDPISYYGVSNPLFAWGKTLLVGIYWPLTVFAFFYFVLMFIFKWVKKYNTFLMIFFGVICCLIHLISMCNIMIFNGIFIEQYLYQILRLWTWTFYFLLGGFLSDRIDVLKNVGNIKWLYLIVIAVITVLFQYELCYVYLGKMNSEYLYDSPLLILYSLVLFAKIKHIGDNRLGVSTQKYINYLGKNQLGIFLIHPILIASFNLTSHNGGWITSTIVLAAVFLVGAIISCGINKVPLLKEILKY